MNLTDAFAENARLRPDHPAVEDGDRVVGYRDLAAMADRAATGLRVAGVAPGDMVALVLPDSVEHVALIWALARMGAVAFPINERTLRDDHVAGLGGRPLPFAVCESGGAAVPPGVKALPLQGLLAIDPAGAPDAPPRAAGGDMPVVCAQSSGTTGTPKSFQMSHAQIFTSVRSPHPLVRMTADDRYFVMIRFGFYTGWRNCLAVLAAGATMIVNQAQTVDQLVRTVRDARATVSVITPLHLRALLKQAVGKPPIFPSMRALRVSTGAITKGERVLARKHVTPNLIVGYGFNELNWVAFATPEDQDAKPDSVGRPNDGIEAQVVDDDGRPLPPGEIGLIRFRAAHAATDYFNDPEATARAFRDGWVYPMDLGAIDADGYIYLKGRADDRLSVDGIKFYPIEVETVLRDHPAVAEAAVFGWPHPVRGEVPVAAVTTDADVDRKSLSAFCRQHLASYKIPVDLVVVPDMPRNPMGKIVKAELKQRLGDRLRRAFAASGPRPIG